MLLILFELEGRRYGMAAVHIMEIAPLPTIRAIPGTPPAVLGAFVYRGVMTPALDLSIATGGAPCRKMLSTRILIINHPCNDGVSRPLGLVVERATETISAEQHQTQPKNVASPAAPFLGAMLKINTGEIIQIVEPKNILPSELQAVIFPTPLQNPSTTTTT